MVAEKELGLAYILLLGDPVNCEQLHKCIQCSFYHGFMGYLWLREGVLRSSLFARIRVPRSVPTANSGEPSDLGWNISAVILSGSSTTCCTPQQKSTGIRGGVMDLWI